MDAYSSSPFVACPLCLFLGGFSRPSVCYGFSLLFFWPSCPSVSCLCQSGAVFWASCPFGCCGSRFSHPLAVSPICRLVSVPVCPRDSCGLVAFVLRTLRWCSAVSLLFVSLLLVVVRPVLFLFSVSSVRSWGRCSPSFPPFSSSGLLSVRPFVLSPCPLGFSFLLVVCSCLLSPVGRFVSPGSPRFWCPSVVRGALPRVVLVLCLQFVSVRLPSFLPLLLLWCLATWWLFFPLGRLLHYVRLGLLIRRWCPWGCVLCCLSPVSLTPPVSWFCFIPPSSFHPPSVSIGCVLSCLRDEVTLVWVECRLWVLPLDRNKGLVCWFCLYSFGMWSPFGV